MPLSPLASIFQSTYNSKLPKSLPDCRLSFLPSYWMTPFLTVQCFMAFLTASSYCSLHIFLRLSIGTSPCQPVRSVPLNRAVKPLGGVLSLGPAFSPALVQAVRLARASIVAQRANHRYIVVVLSVSVCGC